MLGFWRFWEKKVIFLGNLTVSIWVRGFMKCGARWGTIGFVKKTKKTPVKEIELAKRRRDDYIERMGKQ